MLEEKTVLLVEDEPDLLDLMTMVLEELSGVTLTYARDGLEAIEQAIHLRPDLIVLDIRLPELDGLQVARRLRVREDTRSIPIIAVTVNVGAKDEAMAAGCVACLPKPFDINELLAVVRLNLGI